MAQIKKHAEFMDTLHSMITKEAGTANSTGAGAVTGKPGADTHYTSVSKETEKVNKNKEGHPEHNPQEFKQEKASDPSDPTKKHKSAEECENHPKPDTTDAKPAKEEAPTTITQNLAKKAEASEGNEKLAQLGKQLLDTINEMQKSGGTANSTGAGPVTGKPGADTHYTSVSKETEKVDKNSQGKPEHNPQEFKQEKASDPSDPTKHHKSAEQELDKEASFELGRQFARAFLSNKSAAVDSDIYKEAGRRDFEALIAQASAELDQENNTQKQVKKAEATNVQSYNQYTTAQAQQLQKQAQEEEIQIKQAEEAGSQAFYTLLNQAQEEEKTNQVKLAFEQKLNTILNEKAAAEQQAAVLVNKVAGYEAAIQKQAEEAHLENKFATWGGRIVDEVITRLKNESAK